MGMLSDESFRNVPAPETDWWSSMTGGVNDFMGNLFGGGGSTSNKDKSKLAKLAMGDSKSTSTAEGAIKAGLSGLIGSGGNPYVAIGSAIIGGLGAQKRAKLIKLEQARQERELKAQKRRMAQDRKLNALSGLQNTLKDVISL